MVTHHVIPLAEWSEELLTGAPLTPEELVEIARQDNESKKRGFYVDIRSDGSLQWPSDVGEAQARSAIAGVKDLIRWASALTSDRALILFDELRHRPDEGSPDL